MRTLPMALIAGAGWLLPAIHSTADERLPVEAARLVYEMKQWEDSERAETERKIAEKRREVIAALKKLQDLETRRSNLDRALSIKREIERLEETSATSAAEPSAPRKEGHVGMTYVLPWDSGPGNMRVTFHPAGKASQLIENTKRNFAEQFRWETVGEREIEYWYYTNEKGSLFRWKFGEDWKTAKVENRKKKNVFEAKIAEK